MACLGVPNHTLLIQSFVAKLDRFERRPNPDWHAGYKGKAAKQFPRRFQFGKCRLHRESYVSSAVVTPQRCFPTRCHFINCLEEFPQLACYKSCLFKRSNRERCLPSRSIGANSLALPSIGVSHSSSIIDSCTLCSTGSVYRGSSYLTHT